MEASLKGYTSSVAVVVVVVVVEVISKNATEVSTVLDSVIQHVNTLDTEQVKKILHTYSSCW